MKTKSDFLNKALITLMFIAVSVANTYANTYTVTSTSFDGPGSFLEAIDLANNYPGPDIIEFTPGLQVDATFAIPFPDDIVLATITESVIIDGKGGAIIAAQSWVDNSGNVNNTLSCPGDANWLILGLARTFLEVGVFGVDNSNIDVTVKNVSIKQFNQVAQIRKNASLTFDNFTATDTWNSWACDGGGLIGGDEGVSLTIKNSLFDASETWEEPGNGSAIIAFDAADLTIENSTFNDLSKRDQWAILWSGVSGSEVNIVGSRFREAGGILILGDVSVTNFVNSVWVNTIIQAPDFGDRIVNAASGDMNIIASSMRWSANYCSDVAGSTICAIYGIQDLIQRSGSGKINFIQSAVGFNFPDTPAIDYFNTLGDDGVNGFTADVYTWIEATNAQGEAELKTITNQPSLMTNSPAFATPYFTFATDYEVGYVTPVFPGELIDVIPAGTPLINPIDGSPITLDAAGNPRVDANGERDIGAVQLGLAPNLSVDGIGDGTVDLIWNEPLHHDGLSIIKYEIEYSESGLPGSTTNTIDPPALSKTITGLTNGTEYNFQVRAVYTGPDNGPFSNTITATPLGSMGTPVVTAAPGDTEVFLSWNMPDLGGRDFEFFTILWRVAGTMDPFGISATGNTSTTVTGLTNGTTYEFRVSVYASGENGPQGIATATPKDIHEICMDAGWSGVSSYVIPDDPAIENVFAGIVNEMVILLSNYGFYWPTHDINQIGNWNTKMGYKIKMNEPACLSIVGDMSQDNTFTVNAGASYIPVLCDQPVVAADIFSQLGDDLVFAYDLKSQKTYWPQGSIYSLETLEPGLGYLVNMAAPGEATYSCDIPTKAGYAKAQKQVFKNAPWAYTETGSQHLISINKDAFAYLERGTFIGVFNSYGICVGYAQYIGENGNLLLVAYSDDITTKTNDGLQEGEEMTFRIFNPKLGLETEVGVQFDASFPNTNFFTEMGLSMILKFGEGATTISETEKASISIQPNPATDMVYINLNNYDNSDATVAVHDTEGRTVINQVFNNQAEINVSSLRAGIYFVKINTNTTCEIKKLVIK